MTGQRVLSEECDWLEREGLLRREQGLSLDGHVHACQTCRGRWQSYEQLEAALKFSPPPPVGWEARVLRRAEAGSSSRWRKRKTSAWVLPGLTVAAAAAVVLFVVWPRQTQNPAPVVLAVSLEQSASSSKLRGEGRLGGVIRLEARGLVAPVAELRVYRDDVELVASCTTQPPCQRQAERLTARVSTSSVGSYRFVLFTSDRPLPISQGAYNLDDAAARAAGAMPHAADSVEVW